MVERDDRTDLLIERNRALRALAAEIMNYGRTVRTVAAETRLLSQTLRDQAVTALERAHEVALPLYLRNPAARAGVEVGWMMRRRG